MQENILRNAAIVGIEVTVVPLIAAVVLPGAVLPAVVTTDSQHIMTFFNIGGQVEATGHHAILADAQMLAVQIEIGTLTDTFEFHKDFLVLDVLHLEAFAIPDDGVCQVYNVLTECFISIEGIGKGYLLPAAAVVVCLLGLGKVTYG